ncbi:hypothetical protein [Clostridium sp.]
MNIKENIKESLQQLESCQRGYKLQDGKEYKNIIQWQDGAIHAYRDILELFDDSDIPDTFKDEEIPY